MARGRLSRTHNEPPGMFDDDMVDKDEHGFYIKSLGILSRLKQRRMTGEDLKRTLQKKGVSKMELDDLGLTGMLSGRDRVDLDDVEAHIKENKPEFELKTLTEPDNDGTFDFDWYEKVLDQDTDYGREEIAYIRERAEEELAQPTYTIQGQPGIQISYDADAYLKDLKTHLEKVAYDDVGTVGITDIEGIKQLNKQMPLSDDVFGEAEVEGIDLDSLTDLYLDGEIDFSAFRDSHPLISDFTEEWLERYATESYMDDPFYEIQMDGADVDGEVKIIGNDNLGYTMDVNGDQTFLDTYNLDDAKDRAFAYAYDNEVLGYLNDGPDLHEEYSLGGGDNYQVHSFVINPRHYNERYAGTHFDEDSMYHARTKDRPTPDGQGKLLYIEELQSDWGKKFRDNPDFNRSVQHSALWEGRQPPFVTDTKAWTDLAAKQLATYARENGYDGIAFAPGEVHERRYNRQGESGLKRQYDKNLMGSMNTIFERKASVYEDPEGFASGSPMWIFDEKDKQKIDQGFSQYVAPVTVGGALSAGSSLTPTQQAYAEAVNTPMPFERDSIFNLDPDALRAGREMMAGDASGMISDAQRLYGLLSGYFTGEPIAETDKQADETQQAVYGALSEGAADDAGIQNYLGPLQEGEQIYQDQLNKYGTPQTYVPGVGLIPLTEEFYRSNPRLYRILDTIDQYRNPLYVEPNFQR